MPTEYYDDTIACPKCKHWINLNGPRDPGPLNCPHCGHKLREEGENPRADAEIIPFQ
jgi:DNA-directed RNA polymerase subunit RPC12/RpoP